MKNNEQAPRITTEGEKNRMEQHRRQEWGENIAKKFGILYTGEFFVIPQFGTDGKEIKRTHANAWEKIRFWTDDKIEESVGIENVIEAIKKYPDVELREAVKLIKQENNQNKNA